MRQLATLSRKEKYLWMCQLHISFGCVLKLKVLLLLIQFLYLSLKYWCMTRTRVWCSICKEDDGGGGKESTTALREWIFFCQNPVIPLLMFYIQASKSKHSGHPEMIFHIWDFKGVPPSLCYWFDDSIFQGCHFLLFNGLFHDATNHHITKEDEEEDHWGEALWLSDGRRCW